MTFPLYAKRLWTWGNSWVFAVDKDIREELHWRPGDLILVRVHPPYITCRVARPELAVPIEQMGPGVLPPPWPKGGTVAGVPDDSEEAAPAAAGSAPRGDERRVDG